MKIFVNDRGNVKTNPSVYRRLPFAVFAFVLVAFVLHPFSPFATHHLADPDDYMRLDEVIAWLRGQGWYDLSVPRLSPGAHTVVHWSRLVDLPIATLALPFIPRFGIADAVMIAALIVPLLWLAVALTAIAALDCRLNGQRGGLATVMLLFAPLLLFNYTPGRVDHHGAQAVIAVFGLICLDRLIITGDRGDRGDRGRLYAALAAIAYACGFWIGAEALPWAALFIACAGVAAAWTGGRVARDAAWFGLCLPLATSALIPAALPPAQWSSLALSWFSPAYAVFAALAGGILIAGHLLGRRGAGRGARLALYAALALTAAAAFFSLIPSARHGIFTDYDVFDATTALDNITEAQPLRLSFAINRFMPVTWIGAALVFLRWLALPLAALGYCVWQAARGAARGRWLAQGVFLAAALLLAVFWQMRVSVFMQAFMLVPLAALAGDGWDALARRWQGRRLFWAEAVLFCALGPLPVLLIPAAVGHMPLYPDLLLFPAARGAAACNLDPVLTFLNDRAHFAAGPVTIMNTSDTGPQLLYATRDQMVSGNFDVPGNVDARAFFAATDDALARAAAARWQAGYVLLCKTMPLLYLGRDYYKPAHTALRPGPDGMLRFTNTDAAQPLIARLSRGDVPGWLAPVEIPGGSDYVLFRVRDRDGPAPGDPLSF